jgi:acetyl-CoA carboxylase carboxyltransferase component
MTTATSEVPDLGTSWDDAQSSIDALREGALAMGGEDAIKRQHDRGRLTPRERLELLVDPGSFREVGELVTGSVVVPGRPDRVAPADGIVVGWARVNGRRVIVVADDGTIAAGARGLAANDKDALVTSLAANNGIPLVWFAESCVNRMQHVMGAQFAGELEQSYGMRLPDRASRRSPTILAISGQAVGRSSFATTASEFSTMVRGTTSLALAGPSIVRAAIGRDVTQEELGGVEMHTEHTGVIDFVGDSEADSVGAIKKFLDYFPDNNGQRIRRRETDDPGNRLCPELYDIVSLEYRKAYDMRRVVRVVVDGGQFLEVKKDYAPNVTCAYARIDGWPVGIIANNPMFMAGVVDPKALRKTLRFAQICNLYNMPVVFLQDQPGVMVGPDVEQQGVFRHVWRLSDFLRQMTSPVLTVLIRKCYGFSYLLLGSRQYGADGVVAWPSASISLAGPEAGVSTVLAAEERAGTLTEERRTEVLYNYLDEARVQHAARAGRLDNILEPERTRQYLARQLGVFAYQRPDLAARDRPSILP